MLMERLKKRRNSSTDIIKISTNPRIQSDLKEGGSMGCLWLSANRMSLSDEYSPYVQHVKESLGENTQPQIAPITAPLVCELWDNTKHPHMCEWLNVPNIIKHLEESLFDHFKEKIFIVRMQTMFKQVPIYIIQFSKKNDLEARYTACGRTFYVFLVCLFILLAWGSWLNFWKKNLGDSFTTFKDLLVKSKGKRIMLP